MTYLLKLETKLSPIHSFIIIVIIFDFTQNVFNEFINSIKEHDRARWAPQICCTLHINPMVTSIWKIQFKIYLKYFPYILTFTLISH